MTSSNSTAVHAGIMDRLQVKETILVLVLSVIIPYLIHLLPAYGAVPVGAILLAMFFAPYIAVKYFKFHVALLTALSAPFLNYIVTGHPTTDLVAMLTLQLAVFVSASKIFSGINSLNYFNTLLSYSTAMVVSYLSLLVFPQLMSNSPLAAYFHSAFVTGLPGILLLVLVNFVSIRLSEK